MTRLNGVNRDFRRGATSRGRDDTGLYVCLGGESEPHVEQRPSLVSQIRGEKPD